jgi:alpha-beta hydrolase superfamily lysophospholipase
MAKELLDFYTYKNCGIKNVTLKLYPGVRHKMLNETNRNEVMKNIIDWLLSKLIEMQHENLASFPFNN